jgi:uncharacterized protein (DUF1778 family)
VSKKRGEKMPKTGRPPIENPKNINLGIRLTKSEAQMLQNCADELKTTRTDVIVKGIEYVKSTIKK